MSNLMYTITDMMGSLAQFKFPNGFIASIRENYGTFEVAAIHDESGHWVTPAYFGFDWETKELHNTKRIGDDGVELGKFISWVAGLPENFRLPSQYQDDDGEDQPMTEFAEYIVKENGAVVSSGTHRNSDLIQAFMDALYALDRAEYAKVRRMNEDIFEAWNTWGDGVINHPDDDLRDSVSWLINEDLFDSLNLAAPDGFHFGSHEGDGALFGFWPFDSGDM